LALGPTPSPSPTHATGRGLLNGIVTGYVMIPVPEPTSLAMLLLAAPLSMRRRHRR
jgi:hypothetical protein